jgi:iron complex outermembrane receptor protein
MNPATSQLTILLGTASFVTLATAMSAQAQQVVQASQGIPDQVPITGSLIRGTATVGVPVINLGPQDFQQAGALTVSDLLRTVPQFNVIAGPVATQAVNVERGTRVNLRQLDTGNAARNLLMIDGLRYPPQGNGLCQIDPSIIPTAAIERVDLLLDGASATYGGDAIGGVINIVLKRAFDGAVTQAGFRAAPGGGNQYAASQLWGRTWDGGDITLSYSWYDFAPTQGNFRSKLSFDFSPWGLDNRIPIGSSIPGTISLGAPINANDPSGALGFYPGTIGRNCTNCLAVPGGTGRDFNGINGGVGPMAPFSGSTLNWATFNVGANSGTNGTRNVFNPYSITYYSAAVQYTGGAITVDQRLTRNVSFYGEGFYGMRRSQFLNNAGGNQITVGVPTWNPYYPTGGAPTTLRVSYHASIESPSITNAYASGMRYMGGLNIDLPGNWAAQIYYSQTKDSEFNHVVGTVNKNAVSAALGWTIAATSASGTNPAIATWTKPGSVPYLNLFCDATVFRCNAGTTLKYIGNFATTPESFWLNEKGIKADGPLFSLPGGDVKMAVGANYTSNHFLIQQFVQNTSNPTLAFVNDPESRAVWAVFGQVNVPVIGDANALPFVRKLDLEASWRHDQYSDVGGTSNPKVAFTWVVSDDWGLSFHGSWGSSFRPPAFGEFSPISNVGWNGFGLSNAPGAAQFQNAASVVIACTNGKPVAGSGSEKLFNAGFGCNTQPAGISLNGGGKVAVDSHLRTYFNQSEQRLEPEKSLNYSAGFDFAPTFLQGLDIQASWYSIKINGLLTNFGNPSTARFSDPDLGFVFLVPSDVGCPVAQNAHPELCAPFQDMVQRSLQHPTNPVPAAAQTLIYWINDGGAMNKGWQKNQGIDFAASYDFEAGDLGAWNTGIVGTYYIKNETQRVPGGIITDQNYHVDLAPVGSVQQLGVESLPRFKYRARLGWSNGPWSITGFMDYSSHFFTRDAAPPNVNDQCISTGGTVGGGTFPCAINNYSNIEPPYYTFDLSVGYDTGDDPANDYLKHIGIQLIVQNLTNKISPFEYRIAGGGGNPCACDIFKTLYGRSFQLRFSKTW